MQPPKRDRSETGVRDQFGGDRGMMTTRSVTEATGGDQFGDQFGWDRGTTTNTSVSVVSADQFSDSVRTATRDQFGDRSVVVAPTLPILFDMTSSSMIKTAVSQQFRSGPPGVGGDPSIQASRSVILESFQLMTLSVRKCPYCGIMLLGAHRRNRFSEPDGWCCGGERANRQHVFWPGQLPWQLECIHDFSQYARVINSLLSVAVIHGSRDQGHSYRMLSYQAPVMTINGQIYARLMRDANRCWFVHDADYDRNLMSLLKNTEQVKVLELFTQLLQANNIMHRNYADTVDLHAESQVKILMDEETRMCSVYIDNGNVTLPPARSMYVLGSGNVIDEMDPAWEVFGYPVMHFTGNATYAWSQETVSVGGRHLSLLDYARSVMLMQPRFWRYGRLAEQWVLDMWARNEQHNVRSWTAPYVQDKFS